MTELSFLLELLFEHELQKPTHQVIRERIKLIEELAEFPVNSLPQVQRTVVATTSEAIAALQARADIIANAGKPEPGRTSPRKF